MSDQSGFLQAYSQLVVRTWASEEYLDYVQRDPHAALNEVGLEVADDATVNVTLVESTGNGKIEDQIARWEEGARTGVYEIVIANRPEDFDINDMALSEDQLELAAGGDGFYCCSCTPCCCCG